MEDDKTLMRQPHQEDEVEDDDFLEDFKCCVCLDLLYKPVVLGCGHISCFWCVYYAMSFCHESYCPICRHPYNHFPNTCQLLHLLLQKLYPEAYKRREKQVGDEENAFGYGSPQFDNALSGSRPTEESNKPVNIQSNNSESCSSGVGESPSIVNSSETKLEPEVNVASPTTSLECVEATANTVIQEASLHDIDLENGTHLNVSVSDLLCAACQNLLYQPVVLNCGHVYCQSCISVAVDGTSRCQICQSMHPNGFPSVCLILEHFMKEQYPEIYGQGRVSSVNLADSRVHGRNGKSLSTLSDEYLSCWPGPGQNIHVGIGCDGCGMSPIIGERYKCKDCVEKMGFDLCGACYKAPFKIPGRFNQQHKPDHKLELVPLEIIPLLPYQSDEEDAEFMGDLGDVPAVPLLEDPENAAAPNTQDPENGYDNAQNVSPAMVMSIGNSLHSESDSDGCALPELNQA